MPRGCPPRPHPEGRLMSRVAPASDRLPSARHAECTACSVRTARSHGAGAAPSRSQVSRRNRESTRARLRPSPGLRPVSHPTAHTAGIDLAPRAARLPGQAVSASAVAYLPTCRPSPNTTWCFGRTSRPHGPDGPGRTGERPHVSSGFPSTRLTAATRGSRGAPADQVAAAVPRPRVPVASLTDAAPGPRPRPPRRAGRLRRLRRRSVVEERGLLLAFFSVLAPVLRLRAEHTASWRSVRQQRRGPGRGHHPPRHAGPPSRRAARRRPVPGQSRPRRRATAASSRARSTAARSPS